MYIGGTVSTLGYLCNANISRIQMLIATKMKESADRGGSWMVSIPCKMYISPAVPFISSQRDQKASTGLMLKYKLCHGMSTWRLQNRIWLRKIENKLQKTVEILFLCAGTHSILCLPVSFRKVTPIYCHILQHVTSNFVADGWSVLCPIYIHKELFRNTKPNAAIDSAQFCNWIVLSF